MTEFPGINTVLAGGVAGAVSKTAIAPLERVKILCQTGTSRGFLSVLSTIWRKEGPRGLFRGNFVNCVRIIPNKGVLFSCSDFYKELIRTRVLHQSKGCGESPAVALPSYYAALAGSLSGMTASTMTYPLDVIRTRIAGNLGIGGANPFTGAMPTFLHIVRTEGVWALYRGMGPTIVGAIPYEGIKFGTFDVTITFLKNNGFGADPSSQMLSNVAAGAFAGAMAGFLTYPNDTVRRLMQHQVGVKDGRKYKTALHCYATIFRTEGVQRFYRGFLANMIRIIPNTAIQFTVYHKLKSWAGS